MHTVNSPEFARNYGFWDEAAQQALMDQHVAVAGVGGDGFQLGTKLARMGVARFSVADPEIFERENINRVPGATNSTLGQKKVDAFADMVHDINPDAVVRVFDEGVNADNIRDFMEGATLVYDETELTMLNLGTMVSDEARRRRIPDILLMNVGWATQVTSFDGKQGPTFRTLMGIPEDMPLDEVANQELDFSRFLYLPTYLDPLTLETVMTDPTAPLPSIAPGVDLASGLGSAEGFKHIIRNIGQKGWPEPVWAPKIGYLDAMTVEGGVIDNPQEEFNRRLGELMANAATNPQASFTSEDRERRAAAHQTEQTDQALSAAAARFVTLTDHSNGFR